MRHFTLLSCLIVLGLTSLARADGKVFSRGVEPVAMPDQMAVIRFDGETEMLAIETHFDGTGQDFAWLVPVPGDVEVSPVSPGTMAALRAQNGRQVVTAEHVPPVYAIFLGGCCQGFSTKRVRLDG